MWRFFRLSRVPIAVAAALTVVLAGPLIISGIAMASAKAPTITLHFFLKNTLLTATDQTDLLYVGNHKHHATKSTGSDHLRCVVQGTGNTLVCDGQFTIGSSKLLVKHGLVTHSAGASDLPITGGTGKYGGYHGQAKFAGPSHSDLTIVIHR